MGISTYHVVMVGIEVKLECPYDEEKDEDAWSDWWEEWYGKYQPYKKKNGRFMYFAEDRTNGYEVFGKVLEISDDGRWDPAYLKFAPREITEKDKKAVQKKVKEVFGIEKCKPKLYVFTHYS